MPNEPLRAPLEEEAYLDLPAGHGEEELESEVRRARAELDELRRKQEQIEKEKLRLEDLSRRQEELETGKAAILEKLERALSVIQRETEENNQRLEQLQIIGRTFRDHLHVLQEIHPHSWTASEAPKELSKGTAALEEARADFTKAQARLLIEAPDSATAAEIGEMDYEEGAADQGFGYWLKSGFAFTLPLQILGLLALVVWLLALFGGR